MSRLIAITGGIGAGKSVVSRILSTMGYAVYDTDSHARRIMDCSTALKDELVRHFGDRVLVNGCIDRPYLASVVFNDSEKLKTLNSLVHSAVIEDLLRWRDGLNCSIAFVETAILYQSGLDKHVDSVWEVTTPEDVRIARVMRRNGITRDEVKARIASQYHRPEHPHPKVTQLVNDDSTPLLPQILHLLTTV